MASAIVSSLPASDVARYSRQLILPEWGVKAQERIRDASVLIVGAGGLGCPVAQYLAAAGLGHIGVVDYDQIETSNLHRQVLHTEEGVSVGMTKADSVKHFIQNLNSSIKCTAHNTLLSSTNAMDIIKKYDTVVDATDNVATRYLLNDACVLLKKPLVSGSALRFEGQLTVYNYKGGPCYRCLYPSPPPPLTVTNCSEGGVLGAVPGVIGSMQALEVLKITAEVGESYSQRLLMFDGLTGSFRVIKLRSRNSECAVCGDAPTITELIDYEQFCQSRADDKEKRVSLLTVGERITCKEYQKLCEEDHSHVLLDVRERVEFDICHLSGAHNIPLKMLQRSQQAVDSVADLVTGEQSRSAVALYVVCHHGNDSQLAVKLLQEKLPIHLRRGENDSNSSTHVECLVKDIDGGLAEWSKVVDCKFPKY